MDELFFYGYNRVNALIDDTELDKTVKGKIRENLRAMCVAYEKQRSATRLAKSFEKDIRKKYEDLKKQLKRNKTTND